jgi:ACT domain-containing protein
MTELQIRKIVDLAIEELGEKATKDNVQAVVAEVVKEYEKGAPSLTLAAIKAPKAFNDGNNEGMNEGKIIVTSYGINKPGIVSAITAALAEHQCDLQDVSQKLIQEFFTLIMIVDISKSPSNFSQLKMTLAQVGEKIGVQVFAQHEAIFKTMHRV